MERTGNCDDKCKVTGMCRDYQPNRPQKPSGDRTPPEGCRATMSTKVTDRNKTSVKDRIERTISFGAPTCDICKEDTSGGRPDDAEFWPDPAVHYINADAEDAVGFWGRTVCEYHDQFDLVIDEATHRVVDETEYVGDDPERMNSAHRHQVTDVQELQA